MRAATRKRSRSSCWSWECGREGRALSRGDAHVRRGLRDQGRALDRLRADPARGSRLLDALCQVGVPVMKIGAEIQPDLLTGVPLRSLRHRDGLKTEQAALDA